MTDTADSKGPSRKIAWGWVAACELPGAALIGLAFWLEDRHQWQGVSIATFIAVGTALLLAGVLFFFERRFLTDVSGVATAVATEVGAAAARAEVEESTKDLNVRIDQLSDQMETMLAEQAAVHDEAVAAMEVPSFDSVATALAHANRLGALDVGHVTVQGSRGPDELGLTFSWGLETGDGRFSQPARVVLKVAPIVYADFSASGGRPFLDVEWDEGETAADVGIKIRDRLTSRGRLNSDDTLLWDQALANLKDALDIAIRSRRRAAGAAHLQGALAELVKYDAGIIGIKNWMITDAGLEFPEQNYLFSESEFPSQLQMTYAQKQERLQWMPTKPWFVADDLWKRLIERGLRRFPRMRGPIGMPTWIPITKTPEELRLGEPPVDN